MAQNMRIKCGIPTYGNVELILPSTSAPGFPTTPDISVFSSFFDFMLLSEGLPSQLWSSSPCQPPLHVVGCNSGAVGCDRLLPLWIWCLGLVLVLL